MKIRSPIRRWWFAALLGLVAIGEGPTNGPARPSPNRSHPLSIFDPRLESIRLALPSWELRQGPKRSVVDQVCLVSNLAEFFEAVGAWDSGHFFPVLFDDVESSFRFIRAFKPSRIVRMPKSASPILPGATWERAVEAVGASWTAESGGKVDRCRGDLVPQSLGPTPPGLVFSSPDAPMLAGAVALASGRFQPLLRLESEEHFADRLSIEQADALARAIAREVEKHRPAFRNLGDDCDFLTLAGDYPYRYRDALGEIGAIDDRVGRESQTGGRWAYAGRLLGGPAESAYRAMCSLFLQPESALMFNGYDESKAPWSDYQTRTASVRLSIAMPTSQISGEVLANLEGWHETFDPSNEFGLILINSHGTPTEFNLRGGPAHPPDIPRGVPSAVLMIHSFSAAAPDDPATIAGRWLANGSYIFFGSIHEPYLDAFRMPRLVGELIASRVPLVVAARQVPGEGRGLPWRLVFLGDPLYRILANSGDEAPRLERWEPTADWPARAEPPRPPDGSDIDLLAWSDQVALARLQPGVEGWANPAGDNLAETLLAIHRDRLPLASRPVLDALTTEVLLMARKRTVLKARLLAIPVGQRSPATSRTIETLLTADLHLSLSREDLPRAITLWSELMKTETSAEFKRQATAKVGRLATEKRLDEWRAALREGLRDHPRSPESEIIAEELNRSDAVSMPKDRE